MNILQQDRQKKMSYSMSCYRQKQLDFTVNVQIYSLLGGPTTSKFMEYMRKRRNQLCHHSLALLQPNMTDNVSEKE